MTDRTDLLLNRLRTAVAAVDGADSGLHEVAGDMFRVLHERNDDDLAVADVFALALLGEVPAQASPSPGEAPDGFHPNGQCIPLRTLARWLVALSPQIAEAGVPALLVLATDHARIALQRYDEVRAGHAARAALEWQPGDPVYPLELPGRRCGVCGTWWSATDVDEAAEHTGGAQ